MQERKKYVCSSELVDCEQEVAAVAMVSKQGCTLDWVARNNPQWDDTHVVKLVTPYLKFVIPPPDPLLEGVNLRFESRWKKA